MKQSSILPFLIFLGLSIFQKANAQIDTSKVYIFGHSLLDHRPPAIPTPQDETTVPHWLHLLAEADNQYLTATGQYGFLPQHDNFPPSANWNYEVLFEQNPWDSDNEAFGEVDFNTVIITAGNFMQWQAPDVPYIPDPDTSPFDSTREIADWVNEEEAGISIYIYENWPDMAPYLDDGFPPTQEQYENYNQYLTGDFHDWWIEYQDLLLAARPNLQIRMIPVGPIIVELMGHPALSGIPLDEFYEDDAPHGRANLYYLASLISYMAINEKEAPEAFEIPDLIHPGIKVHYDELNEIIWDALNAFNDDEGVSRVFYSDQGTNVSPINQTDITIYPNPTSGEISLEEIKNGLVEIFNPNGQLVHTRVLNGNSTIDLSHLPAGVYHLRLSEDQNHFIQYRKLVKW